MFEKKLKVIQTVFGYSFHKVSSIFYIGNPRKLICNGGIKTLLKLVEACVEQFTFQVHMNSLTAILLFLSASHWHNCPKNIKRVCKNPLQSS